MTNPNPAVYSVIKFGVAGFCETKWRRVYTHDIQASAIESAVVETGLCQHFGHAVIRAVPASRADGMRWLRSCDTAGAIVFCVTRPAHVNVNEGPLRPTDRERRHATPGRL